MSIFLIICFPFFYSLFFFFFFNDTATTEIYTLSLHDALPIASAPASVRTADSISVAHRCSRWNSASLSPQRLPLARAAYRRNYLPWEIGPRILPLRARKLPR